MRLVVTGVLTILMLITTTVALAETPPTEAWVYQWNGPANRADLGLLTAFDPTGRVYVAGTTYEGGLDGNGEDFLLTQLDANGNELWTAQYGGQSDDVPSCLIVTGTGDVIVTGYAWVEAQGIVATRCYDAVGTLLWDRSIPVTGFAWYGFGPQIVEDPAGNFVLCAASNEDYLIVKLSPTGAVLWERSYDGPNAAYDEPADLATDAAGNIYVTGIVDDAGINVSAYGTVKFDTDGTFHWVQFENGDFGSLFPYAGVEVAPDGDIIVAGNPESVCGVFQVRTWQVAADTGEVIWLEVFPPDPCDSVEPVDMAVDGAGNVVVAGFGLMGNSSYHFQTLRYGADGQFQWHRQFDGVGTSTDVASSLALDAEGNAYVAGLTTFPPQNRDWTAVKYTPAGDEAWSVHWAGPSGRNDRAEDIAVSATGDVVLTGHTFSPEQQSDLVAILYRQENIAAATPTAAVSSLRMRAALNPFSHQTQVQYQLGQAGPVRLSVYDVRGRRVRVLHDGIAASGDHEVTWRGEDDQGRALPSGMYVLRLESGRESASVRVGLVR
jgi:hypothetical protein